MRRLITAREVSVRRLTLYAEEKRSSKCSSMTSKGSAN
jgi:hypothetical protein